MNKTEPNIAAAARHLAQRRKVLVMNGGADAASSTQKGGKVVKCHSEAELPTQETSFRTFFTVNNLHTTQSLSLSASIPVTILLFAFHFDV